MGLCVLKKVRNKSKAEDHFKKTFGIWLNIVKHGYKTKDFSVGWKKNSQAAFMGRSTENSGLRFDRYRALV